jgi:hypothetical protein
MVRVRLQKAGKQSIAEVEQITEAIPFAELVPVILIAGP